MKEEIQHFLKKMNLNEFYLVRHILLTNENITKSELKILQKVTEHYNYIEPPILRVIESLPNFKNEHNIIVLISKQKSKNLAFYLNPKIEIITKFITKNELKDEIVPVYPNGRVINVRCVDFS